ncbi:DinB family protein [Streptomyces fildesensis]|uniref:DinB family protein n=1 Tax=Streptomyces fildesensis TaxID=375757 RepID=A0ABW8C968_9ACTN
MTEITAETWPEPPLAGTEAAAVVGALERQRATLAWKCSGLDTAGLQTTVGASSVTLGGLLKHLAHVEDSHFARLWLGSPVGAPWDTVDWDSSPDWDYRSAAEDSPEQLRTLWQESVARSRAIVDKALIAGGLDQFGAYVTRSGERPNLRRILLDLVEEYARHVGHADLIRESVDGLTGEDPPK